MTAPVRRTATLLALATMLATSLPLDAFCWGSLFLVSSTTRVRGGCPTPTLTRNWRLRCYDGCGYSAGTFAETLSGYGECYSRQGCRTSIRCLPIAGPDIFGFNPPSLSSSVINREGYYSIPPCGLPRCRTAGINTITVYCPCDPDGDPTDCALNDPIVVSLGDPVYQLTDRAGGVVFDLGATGSPAQVAWTAPGSDEAFLALDRDGNGSIDDGRELFGDATPQHPSDQPNGFRALAVYDDVLSGGNEDGRISAADAIYPRLRLWSDRDHDGQSEPDELSTLPAVGLRWIDLDYRTSGRVDHHGNAFRYRSRSGWDGGSTRTIWNVFLIAD